MNTSQFLSMKIRDLESLEKNIELVDPKAVLKRGYSITRRNNKIVRSVKGLYEGEIIENEFVNGKVKSKIFK